MAVTELIVRQAKPRAKCYKLTDGLGLYLFVSTRGSRTWRYDFRYRDRKNTMILGKYPEMSLAEARMALHLARKLVASGEDPRKTSIHGRRKKAPTFQQIGEQWLEKQRNQWCPKYFDRTEQRMQGDIFARIGNLPVNDISPPEMLAVIRKVENRGAIETGRRLARHCRSIFAMAIAEGFCTINPAADIKEALQKRPRIRHQPSVREKELPQFLHDLVTCDIDDDTRDALRLVFLTAARSEEIRFMDISEIENLDGDEPLWRIPAARMKKSRPHLVPLSTQAVTIIKRRLCKNAKGLLFARNTKSGSMSENTMLYAIYRMGYHSRATVHGLRGTFSTILHEYDWTSDWIELALAHDEDNSVKAAYNSARYLPQRRKMLQWWADYLDNSLENYSRPQPLKFQKGTPSITTMHRQDEDLSYLDLVLTE